MRALDRLSALTRARKGAGQQRVFFFKINSLALNLFALTQHFLKQLLEQYSVVRKVFEHGIHALNYTESSDESRRQNMMQTVAPQIKPVQ